MKNNLIIAVICLALGGALAWSFKPATPEPETTQNSSATPQKSPPPVSSRRSQNAARQTSASERLVEVTPEATPQPRNQGNRPQNRMQELFKKRMSDQMNARISQLVASLNLTPAQEQQLRDLVSQKIDELSNPDPNNPNPAEAFAKLAELTRSDYLDTLAADLLTNDQKTAHEALKQRELANQVEARALKDLAGLSSLDLTAAQKDAAYDILLKQAEESVPAKNGSTNGIASLVTESLGLDLEALGLDEVLSEGSAGPSQNQGERPNPREMFARIRERQTQMIDQQVESLRPVLNDQQLEQYRQNLERRNSGLLGGILGGGRRE